MSAPPVVSHKPKRQGILEELVGGILDLIAIICKAAWPWREVLVLSAILGGATAYLQTNLGSWVAAAIIVGGVVFVLMLFEPIRNTLWMIVYRCWLRNRWIQAVVGSGGVDPYKIHSHRKVSSTGPKVKAIRRTPLGEELIISGGRKGGVKRLLGHTDDIAEILHVRKVRITIDEDDAGRAKVELIRRDPFAKAPPIPWPNLEAEQLSIWEPVPWGVDENGRPIAIILLSNEVSNSILIAGATRRGKSRGQAKLLTTAALDPNCDMWLMDGKEIELSPWKPVAKHFAGDDGKEAVRMLENLQATVRQQYQAILADGRKKIAQGEYRPQILICDEIATYLAMPEADRIMELLNDIAAKGLAAGVVCSIATQQPAAALHPRFTQLRANLSYRCAYGMNSREGSTMILGQDATSAGYTATSIKPKHKGVGYLLTDGTLPEKFRGYLITDDDEEALISRAIQLRNGSPEDFINATAKEDLPPKPSQPPAPIPQENETASPIITLPSPARETPKGKPALDRDAINAREDRYCEILTRVLSEDPDKVWTRAALKDIGELGQNALRWKSALDRLVKQGMVKEWLKDPKLSARKGNPWYYQWCGEQTFSPDAAKTTE
jgi:S-DNA-T family DNA segregation ATPase FtsK/SpoIIIE